MKKKYLHSNSTGGHTAIRFLFAIILLNISTALLRAKKII